MLGFVQTYWCKKADKAITFLSSLVTKQKNLIAFWLGIRLKNHNLNTIAVVLY